MNLELGSRPPRFEGPVIAFFVVVVTAYAVLLWWSWSAALVEGFRADESVAETGLGG